MALFGKKMSLEDILKAIKGLSEEEKAKVKAEINGEVEEATEEVEQATEPQEETEEQVEESTEETIEEPVEEATEEVEQPVPEEPVQEQPQEMNNVEQDNKEDVVAGLMDRLQAVEEKLATFDELKALMEDYTKKQADSFGYKGAVPGGKKDIHDMSASELKQKMLNGEI